MSDDIQPQVARLPRIEFVCLIALLFATVALSIDAMLPALTTIGELFSPSEPNRAMLVVGAFFLGMGVGTFVTGPLSDAFGRKPVVLIGGLIYLVAALACYFATSLEMLIVARVIQGLGASGPRIVAMAIVRDLYKGREMAQIMSFAIMIFMVVPALAPLMGQTVMFFADWRMIFLILAAISIAGQVWLQLRQAETLPLERRVPFNGPQLLASAREMFSHKIVVVSVAVQCCIMAIMVSMISLVAPIFEAHFDRADSFPLWFGLCAFVGTLGPFSNAKLVIRFGMRKVAAVTLAVVLSITILCGVLFTLADLSTSAEFALFVLMIMSVMTMMGLTMGNLNALAMEPVGHIAGFVASMMSGIGTIVAVIVALPVTQSFNGSHMTLVYGIGVFLAIALALMSLTRRKDA